MIRPGTLLSVLAVASVGYAMFQVKYQVMQLEARLGHIQHQIADDHEQMRVLDAEWSFLTQPARLERLAQRYLDLVPITSATLGRLDSLPDRSSAAPAAGGPAQAAPAAFSSTASSGADATRLQVSTTR